MNENEESKPKPRKRVNPKKRPGNSLTAAKAIIAMPDPSSIDVKDLIPASVKEEAERIKGDRRAEAISKYTSQNVEAILRNVAIGLPEGRAAQLAGISRETLSKWKGKWGDMKHALAHAEAIAQDELYGVVRKGFAKNPRLALEVLERRFPNDWASHSNHKVAGVMMQTQISPEMLAGLHGARMDRDGSTDEVSPDSPQQTIDI
jgi:hypothetical protein